MTEPSLRNLKAAAEELKKTGVSPVVEKSHYGVKELIPNPESDLIQEKMKLEKILQEINNLKGRICQRIEFIKTLERRKRELEKQLISLGEEPPNFLEETKKKLDNLREHIK